MSDAEARWDAQVRSYLAREAIAQLVQRTQYVAFCRRPAQPWAAATVVAALPQACGAQCICCTHICTPPPSALRSVCLCALRLRMSTVSKVVHFVLSASASPRAAVHAPRHCAIYLCSHCLRAAAARRHRKKTCCAPLSCQSACLLALQLRDGVVTNVMHALTCTTFSLLVGAVAAPQHRQNPHAYLLARQRVCLCSCATASSRT
jgi:hypothetical protein